MVRGDGGEMVGRWWEQVCKPVRPSGSTDGACGDGGGGGGSNRITLSDGGWNWNPLCARLIGGFSPQIRALDKFSLPTATGML